jgi:hypothetical protein
VDILSHGLRVITHLSDRLGDNLHDRIPCNGIVRHKLVVGECQVALGQIGIAVTQVIGAGEIAEAPDGEILQTADRKIWRSPGASDWHIMQVRR